MTTFAATMLMLGVLIFVHELGHYLAAKSVDIEVKRFSIGFGPKIVGFRRGETEYILSLIPLGGYVSMGGMYDETMDQIEGGSQEEDRKPSQRDFDAKPIWARAFVLSAGVLMNFALAFVIYTGVSAFWGMPEIDETRVARVDSDALPPGAQNLGRLESGATLVTIGENTVSHWGDVRDAFLVASSGPLEISTENADSKVEIDLPADIDERMAIVQALYPWQDNVIGSINPGSPAERGGLQEGDKVLGIDGETVSHWYDMTELVRSNPEVQLAFSLERNGRELIRYITPESVMQDGLEIGLIGTTAPGLSYSYEKVGFGRSLELGYRETLTYSYMILSFVGELFTGGVSSREIGSVFTIGQVAGQTARQGLEFYLRFVALFSINLAILNLLPIPVLDGGHLMFLGLEAIRRKPLSLETKLAFSKVGFLFLVGIMVLALFNDIVRLMGL